MRCILGRIFILSAGFLEETRVEEGFSLVGAKAVPPFNEAKPDCSNLY